MRLLMISHTILPWTPLYARYFQERGDSVRVVSFSDAPIAGIDVEFVGKAPFDKQRHKHLFLTRVPVVKRIIRRFQPHMLFATYVVSNGLTATLSWDGPLAVSAQGGDLRDITPAIGMRARIRRHVVRYVCRKAALIHSVSQQITDTLMTLGVPREKILQAASGVDLYRFRPAVEPATETVNRIICTRRHEPIYDIATLIDALAILRQRGRPVACAFVGGGHLLDTHRARAAAAGLDNLVTFTGPQDHDRLPEILQSAQVYVSPSLADGTSAALLEAMASGLFPVVSRIPANEAWIDDGRTGLLFTPHKPDELASALVRALDSPDLRRTAICLNRQRVERDGDLVKNMTALAERFDRVLAQVPPASADATHRQQSSPEIVKQ